MAMRMGRELLMEDSFPQEEVMVARTRCTLDAIASPLPDRMIVQKELALASRKSAKREKIAWPPAPGGWYPSSSISFAGAPAPTGRRRRGNEQARGVIPRACGKVGRR